MRGASETVRAVGSDLDGDSCADYLCSFAALAAPYVGAEAEAG